MPFFDLETDEISHENSAVLQRMDLGELHISFYVASTGLLFVEKS